MAAVPLLMTSSWLASAAPVTWADLVPIVRERCVLCHQGETAPLRLRLDSLDGLLAGSSNGPMVMAGDPAASELLRRLRGESQPRMPMTGPPFLADEQIAMFASWVEAGMPAAAGDGAQGDSTAVVPAPPSRPAPGEPVGWQHVAPIFATRCARCHTDDGQMGAPPEGFRLNSYANALAAGERARIVPGNAAASELLRRVRGQSRPRMPFDGPPWLDEADIALVERWIEQGARDSEGHRAALPVGARLRFEGNLESHWVVDGLSLTVTAGTRVDKSPRAGDRVEVRGRVGADGGIVVERIRRR